MPLAFAGDLSFKLKSIKTDFLKEKGEFLLKLPTIVSDWANQPDNQIETKGGTLRADLIHLHAPTVVDLDRVLTFGVSAVQLQQTTFCGEDDALKTEVKGLVGQAALEIAEDVKKSWKGPAGGRTSSRVLGLVRRIRSKAKGMSVLSPKFENLQRMCDDVLKTAPGEGLIEGLAFLQVSALLRFCTEPENILADQAIDFDPLDVAAPPEELVALAAAEQSSIQELQLDLQSTPLAEPDTPAPAVAPETTQQEVESGSAVLEF